MPTYLTPMKTTANDIDRTLSRFPNLRVTVAGDAILDTYVKGHVDRVCREAPVPVVTVDGRAHYCGGGANTAINVAALGAATSFVSVIGDDENGDRLRRLLRRNGVRTTGLIRDSGRSTLTKTRITADSAILARTDEGSVGPICRGTEKELFRRIAREWKDSDVVILSDYEYGPFTENVIAAARELRRTLPAILIVDSKWPGKFRSLEPDGVKPNYREFLQMTGRSPVNGAERVEQVIEAQDEIRELTGARHSVISLDADGVVLIRQSGPVCHFPVKSEQARNTIGAGDTFVSALALALGAGASPRRAVGIACAASRIALEREETTHCTLASLREALMPEEKYFEDAHPLAARLKELKEQGKRIVFANGCFDLLHSGHTGLLHRARLLGDVLVVGLNSDKSIRRTKGGNRPVIPLQDRIDLLSELQSVDYITAFEEDDACRLVREIRPDILVKGSDHSPERIPEAAVMKEMGKEVKILPVNTNQSVSGIIRKIRNERTFQSA